MTFEKSDGTTPGIIPGSVLPADHSYDTDANDAYKLIRKIINEMAAERGVEGFAAEPEAGELMEVVFTVCEHGGVGIYVTSAGKLPSAPTGAGGGKFGKPIDPNDSVFGDL